MTTCDESVLTCADYYLIRFIEDFTDLFARISEIIPDELYAIARNYATLRDFRDAAARWLDEVGDDDSDAANARFEQYNWLTEWIYRRELTAGYPVGGPSVAFFRNDDNLSIVWKADQMTEDDLPLWTA